MQKIEKIREFILGHIGESALQNDVDIFATGLVNSMFVMELVIFVEQEFGVSISGADLNFDYFRTVASINDLVARKLAS